MPTRLDQGDCGRYFTGDGKENGDYPYFGAEVRAVVDGEMVRVHDAMVESIPFQAATTVKKPEDFGGNHVPMRIAPEVHAFYTHLQPGGEARRQGRGRGAGTTWQFRQLDQPASAFRTARPAGFHDRGQPAVRVRGYTLTGTIIGGDAERLEVTPMDLAVTSACPMVRGV